MRIGIDGRLYGLEHTGLGRYVMELIKFVLKNDKKNTYVLFLNKKHAAEFTGRKRVEVVVTNVSIYSFSEQIIMPFVFAKQKLDLLHVPHFNAPLLYPGKLILTIHDLIKHYSTGMATTTRKPWLYTIKRLGYLTELTLISRKAVHIIVPSNFVKQDVSKKLHIPEEKISVTYEAVSGSIMDMVLTEKEKKETLSKFNLTQPFLIYTGNIYPHKNVDILVDALDRHNQEKEMDLELAIICSRSVFWDRLNEKIRRRGLESKVKLLGYVDDDNVSKLYSLALALVHPSKMEGFGLTGLEAMNVGLPVIASNASCLPEVYGEAALFFDPSSVKDLELKLNLLIKDPSLREQLAEKGYLQARKYSWNRMGKETVKIYNQVNSKSSSLKPKSQS